MSKLTIINKGRFALSMLVLLALLALAILFAASVCIQKVNAADNDIEVNASVNEGISVVEFALGSEENYDALNDESEVVKNYMLHRGVTPERADELISGIEAEGSEMSKTLVAAIIERETNYRNLATDEGSYGYVQMKWDTVVWLKSLYNDLPTITSPEEFINNPKAQTMYCARYLRYSNEKFENDFGTVVSSYNMGISNTEAGEFNLDYVNGVTGYKLDIEKNFNVSLAD